jgi:hypothetical protein
VSDPDRLDDFDWTAVGHAYGPAVETPGHLVNLLSEDDQARLAALDHLWGHVLHQGTIYAATEPAAVTIARMLPDHRLEVPVRTRGDVAQQRPAKPMRAELLDFLAAVGESCKAYGPNGEMTEDELTESARADDPVVERMASSMARAQFSDDWPDDASERASWVFYARAIIKSREAAPQLLGAVVPFLSDPDPAVRLSAAGAAEKLAAWTSSRTE